MSTQYRPDALIYFADGPRQGETILAPGHAGQVCVSPVLGEQPRVERELLYSPTGEKTAEGMRVYRLARAGG